MVRAFKISMKVEEPICSFFTAFSGFTISTPASMVIMAKHNNATENYFSLSYKMKVESLKMK